MQHLRSCSFINKLFYNCVNYFRIRPSTVISGRFIGRQAPCKNSRYLVQAVQKHHDDYTNNIITSMAMMAILGFGKKEPDDKGDEEKLINIIKRSVLLIQQDELVKAEQMLHVALRLAQQRQSVDGITYIYDLLANIALERGELDKSETLFVTLMQRLLGNQGVAQDDNKVLHISLKLAEIYVFKLLQTQDIEYKNKAIEGFNFCIDNLKKKIAGGDTDEDTLLLLSLAHEGYSKMLTQIGGNLIEAKAHMTIAVEYSIKSGADTEERQSALHSDLGALFSMTGDDTIAIEHLQEAVDIGRKTNVENLPAFLVNLGLLNLYRGNPEGAAAACKEAYQISKDKKHKEFQTEAEKCMQEIKKTK